jgi:hypothetical protein
MMNVEEYVAPMTISYFSDAGLITEAEKELSAFLSAVNAIQGSQFVNRAARQWMGALEDASLPTFASKNCFRKVTLAAAASLSH